MSKGGLTGLSLGLIGKSSTRGLLRRGAVFNKRMCLEFGLTNLVLHLNISRKPKQKLDYNSQKGGGKYGRKRHDYLE